MVARVAPRFDAITVWLHSIVAVLVLAQFATALSLSHIAPGSIDAVLGLHRSTGLLLWALVAGRLIWRATYMRIPPAPAGMSPLQHLAARTNAYALYVLLLAQPATGLADTLSRAHPFSAFGLTVPVLVAKSRAIYRLAHSLHEAGGWGLAGLVGLHTLAALFHGLVLKDGVLRSMFPGPRAPDPEPQNG